MTTYTTPASGLDGSVSMGAIPSDGIEIQNDSGNPIPVDDNSGSLTVDGKAYRSEVIITRPSNTTAYTAGDVIGIADGGTPANAGSAIHTFSSIGPSAGYVLVQSVELFVGLSAVTSGMGAFRLHLYTASPTAILDNAAFDLASGEVSSYAGYVDLPTPQDFGSTLYAQADYPGRLIKLATSSTSLYGELQTIGGFTPASGTVYTLRIKTIEAGL